MNEWSALSSAEQARQEILPDSGGDLPATLSGPATGDPTDSSLIRRLRDGDQEAASELYDRYLRRLTSLVGRQCAPRLARCAGVEDIVQSAFGSFFRRIGEGYYDIPDGTELWKLLLVIALNKVRTRAVYHHAAKRDTHRTMNGPAAWQRIQSQSKPGDIEARQIELELNEILDRLPAQHQVMVRLRLDGCEVAEVAKMTGRSRRSVERILQEIRARLTELLQEER